MQGSFPLRGRAAVVYSFINFFLVVFFLASPLAAWSQTTYSVCSPGNPSAPCDYDSPQAALLDVAVVGGDTLNILTDTYVLGSTLLVNRSLTLNFNDSIVDANGVRGVDVTGGTTVAITNVTIRNGQAPVAENGGAIRIGNSADLTLSGSVLENNSAFSGGGLANTDATVTISNTSFTGNTADDAGGAVVTTGGAAITVMNQVTVDGNTAAVQGGGLAAISGGRIDIAESAISRNGAVNGAVDLDFLAHSGSSYSCGNGFSERIGQTFTANVEALTGFSFRIDPTTLASPLVVSGNLRDGGPNGPVIATASAVIPAGLPTTVFDLAFTLEHPVALNFNATYAIELISQDTLFLLRGGANPYAGGVSYTCNAFAIDFFPDYAFQTRGGPIGDGGGIYSAGEVNLVNSTVSRNVGDGAFASSGNNVVSALLSTIVQNSGNGVRAQTGGAGSGGVMAFGGSIVAQNGGNDCARDDLSAFAISQDHNLFGDITGCDGNLLLLQGNDQAGSAGTPIDPVLGVLQDNGGPTFTHALDPSSPAVDAGLNDPTCGFGAPFSDQRGISRPQGAACDTGAFELAPPTPPLQSAIDGAGPGGIIEFPGGTVFNEAIVIGDGKTLQSDDPLNPIVIDATGLNTSAVTSAGDFTLIGVAVTGGVGQSQGGGINIAGLDEDVILNNVEIYGNNALFGAGIYVNFTSNLALNNVTIESNIAGVNGGGILFDSSNDVTMANVRIADNTADDSGGGIYDEGASTFIGTAVCAAPPPLGSSLSNQVENNTATNGQGGGVYTRGFLTIADTNISSNTAFEGGGIYREGAGITFLDIDCALIDSNVATGGSGGGISMADGAVTIDLSLLQANSAATDGGAIDVAGGDLTVDRSELMFNGAGSGGGGAINLLFGGTITNSTLEGNSAPFGGGGAIRAGGTLVSVSNTYDSNTTNLNGGAILVSGFGSSGDDVFLSNSARNGGGAISFDPTFPFSFLGMDNGTLWNNQVGAGLSVSGRGGAVEVLGGFAFIIGTQFMNNVAPEAGDGSGQGGAIFNAGEMTLTDSSIEASVSGDGGAIYNQGALSIAGSTFNNNTAQDGSMTPTGGAITTESAVTIVNSTLSGNQVTATFGTGDGGAIYFSNGSGNVDLNNVTLAFNSAPAGGAFEAGAGAGSINFGNSLLFGNTGAVAGCAQVQSLGFNLADVAFCTPAASDLTGDAMLGLLADNGGPTLTHSLQPGSPALDAGGPLPVSFPQFDAGNFATLTTQGATVLDGTTLFLAGGTFQVGSAYVSAPVDVASDFSAQFDFQITPGGLGGADGITFTITDDPNILGSAGGFLGTGVVDVDPGTAGNQPGGIINGVSVEFDTWDNGAAEGANDPGVHHIGINLDGSASSIAIANIGPAEDLADNSVWTAWIDYNATTDVLEVRTTNSGSRPASPTLSAVVDIASFSGANAYVGFTGATGSSGISGQQRVLNFQFANSGLCETVDQRGTVRPVGPSCDIGAFEGAAVPATIDNAILSVTSNTTQPGVIDIRLIDIPIERLTGAAGDASNPPESAPLSSFPLSSFPLSSLNLRASPMSSLPLSSFPLSSFGIAGAPLSSFPLSSLPLLSKTGGWSALIEQIPSLAGAPLQTVTLEQVLKAPDLPAGLLDNLTLGSFAIQNSPLSSLSLAGLALGDAITVAELNLWFQNAGGSAETVCTELAPEFTNCASTDTLVSLQVKSAPLSSLPLSSLPMSSFPLSSFGITEAPLSSLPLSSLPLSSFPLSSFPLSSFPLSSLPLSSLPLSSLPLSSLDLLFAPLSSLPLSSFPLSSLPLSSLDVGGQPFCDYYDTLALADSQPTCSQLGINPNNSGLADLLAALQSPAGGNQTTLANTPLSSFPMSSFDISSVPLSSLDVTGAAIANSPLSSLPLSSLQLGVLAGCELIDGTANCDTNSLTPASSLIDVAAEYGSLAASPLSSFPLSSLPLSSLPMSSLPLSSLEINGAPLSSFPMSSFDIIGSPLSSLPLSSLPLSSLLIGGTACDGCQTLGDAFAAGQVIADAPLSSLTSAPAFGDILLGDLLGAFTLQFLHGINPGDPDSLGDIADLGDLTLGQLLVSLILRSDFPWENISLDRLDPQTFSADNAVGYRVDFELNGTLIEPVTVEVTMANGFYFVPGSASLVSDAVGTPLADPTVVAVDDTVTLTFSQVSPGAYSNNTIAFVAVPPLSLGTYPATANLALGAAAAAPADSSTASVTVVPSANNDASNILLPAMTEPNVLILGHIDTSSDNDYFQIDPPPVGSRVTVFMTNPAGDNDLLLYEPLSAVEAKGQSVEAAALDALPFGDDGVNYGDNATEEPDALDDLNIGVLPLSSLSTNRGTSDEQVSAVSDGNPYTIQVSGYNGSISEQPYTLRVKVTPEVPVTQCTARPWPGTQSGAQTWSAAGAWTANTNAVFLVNWERLAASDAGDATAADAALNAINALVTAPGVIDGVVVDVSTIPGVSYTGWDFDPCNPNAANAIVNAITAYLESQRAGSPNLAYVTIVGSDEVIPFKRKGDETAIANESTFADAFSDNAMYGALANRNFLSDDTYGDIDPVRWFGRYLNVPELAVGRLVESAADIQTAAENYVTSGGLLTPINALSAGYDFIADASADVQDTFTTYGLDSTALVDQPGTAPGAAWTRDIFLDQSGLLANNARDVVSFNMHFDYDEALPSSGDASGDYSSNLFTVNDLLGKDLTGRLWFTVGCHSGINLADISVVNGESEQDWAQTLNSVGAVYVGQAAYGLGDTVALALTERLLANFARNLNGTISAGQAHAFAKQDYFRDLGVYGEYDYKALQASVYFGLPMYRIVPPVVVPTPLPPLRPVLTDPISGLKSSSLSLTPVVTQETTDKGELFSVDGDTQFVHYRPLQPIVGIDVTSENPNEVARSAFLTGLTTQDILVTDMAFARPVIDEAALEPEIETDEIVFPTKFTNVTSYRVPSSPEPFADRQQLNVIVGQYTSNAGESFGTQRLFNSVDVQVFYQDTGLGLKASGAQKMLAPDDIRPELDNVKATVLGQSGSRQAAFTVDATDITDTSGTIGVVKRVAVLYRQSVNAQAQGIWVLTDLVKGAGNTWTGGGPVADSGLQGGKVDYLVQAVDQSSNVASSSFKGLFYVARELGPQPPPGGGGPGGAVGISLTANGQPVNAGQWITADPVSVEITNLAPGVSYEYSIDSPDFIPLTGSTIIVSGDGLHVVTVREVGGANPVSFAVLIDTNSPTPYIAAPADGQFIVQGVDVPNADYECVDSGSGPQYCNAPVSAGSPVPSSVVGEQTFTLSSQDFAGNPVSTATNTYYVVQPLVASGPVDPVSIEDGITITLDATDLSGFDEVVSIDWGDGTAPQVITGASVDELAVSHVYAEPNIYQVTVTVDYDGAFTQQVLIDFVVIYDPAGGFVTGGGWIDSPPGAYTPSDDTDPDLVGRAQFGFVAKYKKGRSTPDGNTNFRFKAADLRFKSTDYEWLIISGARARFKGVGEVNGGPDLYKFQITALDADVNDNDSHVNDSFRIKIWRDGEGVLYDNGRGVSDTDGDGGTTALGGGSVSIHSD